MEMEMEMAQTLIAHPRASRRNGVLPGHPSCGHVRHVGACPSCQRAQLARWDAQLAEASRGWRNR
jgi:hypothetical protein